MKKVISIFLSLVMLICVTQGLSFPAYARVEGDYRYEVTDGKAEITKYLGTDTELSIPSTLGGYTVTSIGINAFEQCTSLTSVYGVPDTKYFSFSHCTSLKTVTFSEGTKTIGERAFYYCKSLSSIRLPDSIQTIGDCAFYECESLNDITLPDNITTIQNGAFSNTAYYNDADNWDNGDLYIGNHLIEVSKEHTGDYTVREGTKSIAAYAFSYCNKITNIKISDRVVGIGRYAFNHCIRLLSLNIPDSTIFLGEYIFAECESIINISVGSGVSKIDLIGCAALSEVNYNGTKAKWHSVKCNSGTNMKYTVYCTDGTIYDSYDTVHTYALINEIDPTCYSQGSKTYKCKYCNDRYIKYTNQLTHSYTNKTIIAPTCTEAGRRLRTCKNCGYQYYEDVKALGHKYVAKNVKAKSNYPCYVSYVCSRCGNVSSAVMARLSSEVYQYNGKNRKPKVQVYEYRVCDISSKYYDVIYPKNCKKPGTYTVKIVMKGKYKGGVLTKKYKIVKKLPKAKITSAVTTVNHRKEKVTFNAKWKNIKGVSGYQIQMGEEYDHIYWGKKTKIKGSSKTSYNKKLTYASDEGGTHVRIRTYKVVNGETLYGQWSKAKKVKIKNIY